MKTVALYRENRLDRAEEHDPRRLAAEFVATLRGETHPGYEPSGSCRIDDEFVWWLSDRLGMNSTWEPKDRSVLLEALVELMSADAQARRAILDCVDPELRSEGSAGGR